MTVHEHRWSTINGRCTEPLKIGARTTTCYAEKCAVTECTAKSRAPSAFCLAHAPRGRKLVPGARR